MTNHVFCRLTKKKSRFFVYNNQLRFFNHNNVGFIDLDFRPDQNASMVIDSLAIIRSMVVHCVDLS